jgi:DNA-directed RNA polymerase sigma subunit (sigma70/sigma32)
MRTRKTKQPASPRLRRGQVLSLAELDQLLDVRVRDFERRVARLVKEFRAKGIRVAVPPTTGRIPLQPDDSRVTWLGLYEAQVQRLPRMDRAEEFLMARRYEFIKSRAAAALREVGFKEEIGGLLQGGAGRLPELPGRPRPAAVENLRRAADEYVALRNYYVEGALYMVLGCVQRYRNLGVDVADLIQEGSSSLFQAIDGFDWRRDVRFKTYAQYWIHQAILKVLYNTSRTVRLPVWVQKALSKINKIREQSLQATGEELSDESVGERLGVSAQRVREIVGSRRYTMSLDAEVAGDDGTLLGQLLPDERVDSVFDTLDDGDLSASLDAVMEDLPSRERMILTRRYGLHGAEPETLGAIAEDLGITAERVRQLQKAALGRLQRPSKVRRLRAYAV